MIEIRNGDVVLYNVNFDNIIPRAHVYVPFDTVASNLPGHLPALVTMPDCDEDLEVHY